MTNELRTTSVTSYRTFINDAVINGLRSVYNGSYGRERQFQNLKVTLNFPLKQVDYPCIVVEYQGSKIYNAGVGHEEWFTDATNILRKWNHNRFEGTLNFSLHALSPQDRDILTDSLVEILRFGRLDAQLIPFFYAFYGQPTDPVMLMFNQLMLNIDEIDEGGNSAAPAPWQPEDVLVYSTELSVEVHGGYYNTYPADEWQYITKVDAQAYPQGEVDVVLPFNDSDGTWSNPIVYEDDNSLPDPDNLFVQPNWLAGKAVISGVEEYDPAP